MDIRQHRQNLNYLIFPLGLVGMVAVALYNWRLWQRDKQLLSQGTEPKSLPPLEEWAKLPEVTVLVAAWNENEFIERHIESFMSLRYPHKELVLCAGGEDGTHALAQHYVEENAIGGVIILEQMPGEGKQQALAKSLPRATGSIIFLTDADCLLDDGAFERTLMPVALGEEQACTGGYRPLPEQLNNPFVLTQAASQIYSDMHGSKYRGGISGANCAIQRSLLETSQGLNESAHSGTDYVLAKMLLRAGARIRHLPQSRVTTRYPAYVTGYMRQQRRWLRNVALHGRRFGAHDEMRASLISSFLGLTMLLMPFLVLGHGILTVFSLLLLAHATLSRFRYLVFSCRVANWPVSFRLVVTQPLFLLIDFFAWIQPLRDYLRPQIRDEW